MPNIGLCFVNPAPEIDSTFVGRLAKRAEEIGLHSFWVNDRITYDNLEPTTVAAAAAAVTQRIKIGTSILLAALRSPVILAKTLASLDFLSHGRLIIGIGFGGSKSEFDAVEVLFKGRGARAMEQLRLMKRLWQEEHVNHHEKYFKVADLTIGPRPVQLPHPPVWMGGGADVVLRRVGRVANGYICGTASLRRFGNIWETICGYAAEAGRNPDDIEKAGISYLAIDKDKSHAMAACEAYLKRYYGSVNIDIETNAVIGPPEVCAESINSIFENGIKTLILRVVVPDLRQLDLLGERVLTKI